MKFYFEIWGTGFVNAKDETSARKKLESMPVHKINGFEDGELDITIEEEEYDE